ncbi:MAG: hypothetical protein GDA50_02510 [Alphaproteobacteria bacterium GM202ARS2]|nr:hypothetical protein [Alphaproteobacteria bacterium GM202ARS2]
MAKQDTMTETNTSTSGEQTPADARTDAPGDARTDDTPEQDQQDGRPPYVPEAFWDADKQTPLWESLAQAYSALEKRQENMVELPSADASDESKRAFYQRLGVPEKADDYAITIDGKPFDSDSDVNALLHKEGFTQKQAQLVYSLAKEKLVPMVEWAAAQFHGENERQRLIQHFGGEDKWHATSKQLIAWGEKNLDPTTYDALTRSADGVIAIHSMMTNKEPSLQLGRDASTPARDREHLRKMVASPAYWRDKDPETLRRVHQGFETLFGGSPGKSTKT